MLCLKYSISQATMSASFVCNVTEAVPFCELLIHRNVTFLKNLQKFHSQHLVIGCLVRHSGKMNCMNYLTFCNFRLLALALHELYSLVVFYLSVCACLPCGGRIKIVNIASAAHQQLASQLRRQFGALRVDCSWPGITSDGIAAGPWTGRTR